MTNINIDNETRTELHRIFGEHCSKDGEEIAQAIAQLAFEEWIGWLSGTVRHTSITDQSIDRVINIFSNLMPNKEPDVNFLYNYLSIPYGRARYISQVALERQLRDWNDMALKQLIKVLELKKTEVEAMKDDRERNINYVRMQLNKRSMRLLISAIDQMPENKKPIDTFKLIASPLHETKTFELKAANVNDVLESVKRLNFV
jgi:hypothetical protein